MTKLIIENDIPIPLHHSVRYPFGEMVVGDSIQIEGRKEFLTARNSASQWGKQYSQKFISRKNDDGGRIWRIE